MDAHLTHQIDQYDAWLRETIRRCGWAVQGVLGDSAEPPFAYTVGLSGFDHAELVLFNTSQIGAARILNELGELVRDGAELSAGGIVELSSVRVYLLEFPESEHWLLSANQLYRLPGCPPVPALLVLPEEELHHDPDEDLPCRFCQP